MTPERENGGMHGIDITSNWCRGDTTRRTRQKRGLHHSRGLREWCRSLAATQTKAKRRYTIPVSDGVGVMPSKKREKRCLWCLTGVWCPPMYVPAPPRAYLSPRPLFPSFFIPPLPLLSSQVPPMLGQMPK